MKSLSDREFVREWMAFFGPTTGARLLGWCVLTGVRMPDDAPVDERSLIDFGWGAPSTRYRNVGYLKRFKAYMDEKGFVLAEEAEGDVAAPARLLEVFA